MPDYLYLFFKNTPPQGGGGYPVPQLIYIPLVPESLYSTYIFNMTRRSSNDPKDTSITCKERINQGEEQLYTIRQSTLRPYTHTMMMAMMDGWMDGWAGEGGGVSIVRPPGRGLTN